MLSRILLFTAPRNGRGGGCGHVAVIKELGWRAGVILVGGLAPALSGGAFSSLRPGENVFSCRRGVVACCFQGQASCRAACDAAVEPHGGTPEHAQTCVVDGLKLLRLAIGRAMGW